MNTLPVRIDTLNFETSSNFKLELLLNCFRIVMANLWHAWKIYSARWLSKKIKITEHKRKNIYKKENFKNKWQYVNLTALKVFLTDKELLETVARQFSARQFSADISALRQSSAYKFSAVTIQRTTIQRNKNSVHLKRVCTKSESTT